MENGNNDWISEHVEDYYLYSITHDRGCQLQNIIIKYISGLFFIDSLKMNNEHVIPQNILGTLRSIDYTYLHSFSSLFN